MNRSVKKKFALTDRLLHYGAILQYRLIYLQFVLHILRVTLEQSIR